MEPRDLTKKVNTRTIADSYSNEPMHVTPMSAMVNHTSPLFRVDVCNDSPLSMDVDSASTCSITSDRTVDKLGLPRKEILPSSLQLRSYTKEHLDILAFLEVSVSHKV